MGSIEEVDSIEFELDDISQLSTLTEKSILAVTAARFKRDIIYTYIGDILIAVNPYKKLDIYDNEAWQKKVSESVGRRSSPHVFSIASLCYNELLQSGESQCCVITGESGAGKTETTKFLLEHIVHVSRQKAKTDIHVKIIQVNPLLEAFGNAKTVMNDNSSRFGKFIELYFDNQSLLYGAHISEYLLEKSRVVHCNRDEGNFHVFNYLLASLTDDQQQSLFLSQPTYRIVSRRPTPAEEAVFYTQWQHLLHIMDTVGFMADEVHMVTVVLAAIIHLAEIVFQEDADTNGVFISNERSLEHVSSLLEVNAEDLARALISSKFSIKGESVVMLKNLAQASDGRDALVKALYSRLFGWIVRQVNAILQPNKLRSATANIGILDIAGFENASVNGFEQLCINATNEQLNFYFNQRIFQWELDEYRREGLDVGNLTFVDNRCVVNLLLESPLGVFSLLDEESKFPQASDRSYVDKLMRVLGKVPCLHRPKGAALSFIIHHSPTSITYSAENFLEKNRDTLSSSLQQCLAASERHLVAELFTAQTSDTGALLATAVPLRSRQSLLRCKQRRRSMLGGGVSLSKHAGRKLKQRAKNVNSAQMMEMSSGQTMSNQFKNSLADLMNKLLDCKQWFIRCLKPNTNKTPGVVDSVLLGNQLRYTGVLDTVEIQRQGFATRLSFATFLYRYQCIVYPMSADIPATPAGCANVLNKLGLSHWQIGKSKVFLKHWHTDDLDARLAVVIGQVIVCQAVARRWLARRLLQRMKLSVGQYSDQCKVLLTNVQQHSESIVDQLKIQLALDTTHGCMPSTAADHNGATAGKLERLHVDACDSKGKKLPSTIYTPTPFTLGAGLPSLPDDAPPSPTVRQRAPSPAAVADSSAAPKLLSAGDCGEHLKVAVDGENDNGCTSALLEPPPFALTPQLSPVKLRSVNNGPTKGKPNPSADKDCAPSVLALTTLDPGSDQAAVAKAQDFYKMLFDKAATLASSRADDNPWAVLHYIEKDRVQASFCLVHSDIVVNNSNLTYSQQNSHIGLNGVKVDRRHFKVARILKAVGEGVKLTRDGEGNIYARRLTDCDIIVKGYKDPSHHCLSSAVIENMGRLGTVPMKIFDMTDFSRQVSQLTSGQDQGQGSGSTSASLHRLCQVAVSFQQNTFNDLLTPCWLCLVYTAALSTCPPSLPVV